MYLKSLFPALTLVLLMNCESHGYRGDHVSHGIERGEEPVVTTRSGVFRGSLMRSRRGKTIYAFRGIRFAEPPIGERRFQAPVLIERYAGAVDATQEGPGCPQRTSRPEDVSEDCLRLNVYSNRLQGDRRGLAPVLVYFHAGGFYAVSAQSFRAGPQYLLDHDVTIVTVNYRLGSLGFISTGDKHAPGNLGLKDQVMALRWIQRNIAGFGGDPAQVTISGYSAGSRSVTLHMLSPMSKGLFHRAICMSAAVTGPSPLAHHQRHIAEKQARILGCPTNSSEAIIGCLMTKDQRELGNSLPYFYEFFYDPVLIWTPVVEPDVGQERFLAEAPEEIIRAGKINDVPLIIGMCELEFANQAFSLLQNETLSKEMDDNWDRIAPISFQYPREPPESARIAQELRSFYLGDRKLVNDNDTAFALGKIYGDALISFPVHRFANLMVQHLSSPVYYYKFNYTGKSSHYYYPGTKTPIVLPSSNRMCLNMAMCAGAVHHDDLLYLFNASRSFEPITLDSPHSHMVDKMTAMWTNFAATGNPNPRGEQPALAGLQWPVMTSSERKYLQVNSQFAVQSNMFEERFRLWERLFPLTS